MSPEGAERILITRCSAIGDCILTLPVLNALRDHFPESRIAWLMEAGPAFLLNGHANLDELIVVEKGWLKSPTLIRSLRKRLRDFAPQIVIDPQSLTKSALAGWLSGAPRRIGFSRPQGREIAPWLNRELVPWKSPHLVDAQLGLLTSLGISQAEVRFDVPRDSTSGDAAARFCTNAHLGGGFVAINTSAGWDSKLWPAERFGLVARHIGERWNLPSAVVWAGDRERASADQIVLHSGGHAIRLPATNLRELAAVLRQAKMYVGSDTGPMHLAAAVETPCVGLFGPTDPAVCGPYGTGHRTVQAYRQTSRGRKRAQNDAMLAIEVEVVASAVDEILESQSEQPCAPAA